jgi:hypothetical protein
MTKNTSTAVSTVGIRPESSILTVLSALNYTAWYAIAEFVDNSIQSYLTHENQLRKVEGKGYKLRIEINFDRESETIEVVDNAAGIYSIDYQRAFRPAAIPENNTGLSEFGMGMKSAACWFTWTWSVRSKALYEPVERQVWFDVKKIASEKIEELPVTTNPSKAEHHYTIIRLENLGSKFPATRTYTKIRSHLASMYRQYLRTSEIEIYFDREPLPLKYEEPAILNAPKADGISNEILLWRKDIDLNLGGNKHVKGFAAIRRDGSTTHAGFALFRRNRLIVGSDDETYRPSEIFGRSNDFRYQRIFGELYLTGFGVSHTKDGIKWEDSELHFIETLKDALKSEPLDLLAQAHKYRSRVSKSEIQKPLAKQLAQVQKALARPAATSALSKKSIVDFAESNLAAQQVRPKNPEDSTENEFRIPVENETWLIKLKTDNDPTANEWITSREIDVPNRDTEDCALEISIYIGHPVIARYLGPNQENLGFLVRLAIVLGLAKEKATRLGVKVTPFMYLVNKLMREAVIDD